jgi:hypothetical protein
LAVAILTAAPAFPLVVLGQSQDQPTESVADAARRAREQKKAAAKQPAPVITDDTLKRSAPSSPDASGPAASQASEAGPAASGSAQAAQPLADSAAAPNAKSTGAPAEKPAAPDAAGGDADQKAQDSAELAALKQQVADAQKGLELLQRDVALQQDTYLSNPDYARDTSGKSKLDAMQQQVADKQQEVNDLKARLAALQASPGGTPPAAPPAPPQS